MFASSASLHFPISRKENICSHLENSFVVDDCLYQNTNKIIKRWRADRQHPKNLQGSGKQAFVEICVHGKKIADRKTSETGKTEVDIRYSPVIHFL